MSWLASCALVVFKPPAIGRPTIQADSDRPQLDSRGIGARRILKDDYQNRVGRRHDAFAIYRFTFQNGCVSWEHVQGADKCKTDLALGLRIP